MKAWRIELRCNNQSPGGADIPEWITLTFVICALPYSIDCTFYYIWVSQKVHINFQVRRTRSTIFFHRWFKVVCQKWKGFGVTCSDSANFQWWYWHGIWQRQMCYISSEERQSVMEFHCLMEESWKDKIERVRYKYPGILQADQIRHTEMKEKVKIECSRKVRMVLEANLNDGNIIKGINTWAVSLLRCPAAFIDWNGAELTQLNRRTRKLITIHNPLHPKSNVDHLYIPRK